MRITKRRAWIGTFAFIAFTVVMTVLWIRSFDHLEFIRVQIGEEIFHLEAESWTGAVSFSVASWRDPFTEGPGVEVESFDSNPEGEKRWHTGFALTVGYPFTEGDGYSSIRMPHWMLIAAGALLLTPWIFLHHHAKSPNKSE